MTYYQIMSLLLFTLTILVHFFKQAEKMTL